MAVAVGFDDITIEVGRVFNTTQGMKDTVTRLLLSSGKAIVCGNGGSRQKRYSCKSCTSFLVRATRQASQEGVWKITFVHNQHVNCTGSGATAPITAVIPFVDQLVRSNPTISGPALKRTLKEVLGVELSDRSANRAKNKVMQQTKEEEAKAYTMITSFCNLVHRNCPGSVAVVEVRRRSTFAGDA